jgi:predicted membrane-bound spermidine synthase
LVTHGCRVIGGVSTFLLYLLVWNTATLTTEFVAAIVGAVVGGVIALLVQLIALSAAARERQQERLETQAALGRSVLYKMVSIHSNLFKLAPTLTRDTNSRGSKGASHGKRSCRS